MKYLIDRAAHNNEVNTMLVTVLRYFLMGNAVGYLNRDCNPVGSRSRSDIFEDGFSSLLSHLLQFVPCPSRTRRVVTPINNIKSVNCRIVHLRHFECVSKSPTCRNTAICRK